MTGRRSEIASDNCAKAWGACMRDPRCQDTLCPEHPAAHCTTCAGGPCATPQACLRPLADVPARNQRRPAAARRLLPTTSEGWGRVICTGMGLAGAAFIFGHVGRYFGWF